MKKPTIFLIILVLCSCGGNIPSLAQTETSELATETMELTAPSSTLPPTYEITYDPTLIYSHWLATESGKRTTQTIIPITTPIMTYDQALIFSLPSGEYLAGITYDSLSDMCFTGIYSPSGELLNTFPKAGSCQSRYSPNMKFYLDYPYLYSLVDGKIIGFDQPGTCEAIYWSPDSRHFTAHCSRDNADSIYLFSSEDYSTFRVEESGDPSPDVMWSPDSQSFMTSYYVNNAADLYLFSLENNSIQRITEEGRNSRELEYVSWSPDGKWIAYDYGVLGSGSYDVEGLHIMNTECFSDPSTCVSEGTGIKVSPPYTWSPDSRYLAGTTTDNYTDTSVINVLQVNDGALALFQTYPFNSPIYKLSWSPSGKWIYANTGEGIFLVSVENKQIISLDNSVNYDSLMFMYWIFVP